MRLQQATAQIAQKGMSNPDEAGAAATEYLRLFGLVALAFMWCKAAEAALPKAGTADDGDGFYKAKVEYGEVLHGAHPAADIEPVRIDHGRRQDHDGLRGRGVLRERAR